MSRRSLRTLAAVHSLFFVLAVSGCEDGAGGASGQSGSIQRLIDQAAPGSLVRLPAGFFREQIVITKHVTLAGSSRGTIITFPGSVDPSDVEAARSSDDASLSTITIRGVDCQGTGLVLVNLIVEGGPDDGISIRESSNCRIEGVRSLLNDGDGIDIRDSDSIHIGSGMGFGCNVSGNLDKGIDVRESTNVTIDDCTMEGNGDDGLRVRDESAGVLVTNSVLSGNEDRGARIRDSVDVVIKDSVLSDNGEDGIRVRDSSLVSILDNLVSGNGENGILIKDSSDVDVIGNAIVNNVEFGVRSEDSTVELDMNTISGNGRGPVLID